MMEEIFLKKRPVGNDECYDSRGSKDKAQRCVLWRTDTPSYRVKKLRSKGFQGTAQIFFLEEKM